MIHFHHLYQLASSKMRRHMGLATLPATLLVVLAIFGSAAKGQQITGTLSGVVHDSSGAVVPGAQVVLKNEASGDIRTVPADSGGRFVITAIQPASYSITITSKGFATWQENEIVMNQGDTREIPNIKLSIGSASSKVDVVAGGSAAVPTDTAEISSNLNQTMIDNFPMEGRDAGELMKIMPGMALNNGGSQGSSFKDISIGSNSGPVGAYSSNGTMPYGTTAYMLDGANLVDPGNFGTQIANINPDMIGSIKFLTSNYGAEYAKGPTIFQAFSRSGGQQFHGEVYYYTHPEALDSVDAYTKAQGGNNASQSYNYIGGNIGGPVLLPFTKWNHDRKKLFFWVGYEYMKQQPAGSIINYNVPNAAQLGGDFSNTGIDPSAIAAWPKFYDPLNTSQLPEGGTANGFPVADIDPDIPGILKLYPATNQTPTKANGYTNYRYVNNLPQNRWEATGKLDYAISDNTKLTGSYSYQKESDLAPISIWWATPNTLPYPTPGASNTVTYMILTNLTHVFNPTTTNEFVFTISHFVNPYKLLDPAKASRAANNFNVPGLFGNTTSQIPNFEPDYCCSEQLASINYYPMSTGTFGGIKQVPALYDNFTKVFGNHTLKAGAYWDDSRNSQNNNAPDNGTFAFQTYGQNSTTNLVADLMLGRINSYSQENKDVPQNTQFHQYSLYGEDSWRALPKLTANIGLRLDHEGQWYGIGSGQPGFQVWNQAAYNANPNAANPGILWHNIASNIPISGFHSPLFYYSPRIGLAYDLFGTGKTVLRGGVAWYRYQATSETASAQSGPFGSFNYTSTVPFNGYANVANLTPPSSTEQNGSSIDVMQEGDARSPWTVNYNFTISQALPGRTLFEASYVGNHSAEQYLDGSNSNIGNLNNSAPGAYFGLDPIQGKLVSPSSPCETGTIDSNQPIGCGITPAPTFTAQNYRPLQSYQNVIQLSHAAYSYYNSLQVSFTKQTGPVTFMTNYTYSKVLGIRDGGSNNGPQNGTGTDPFVLRHNYGPLAFDHTNILNLTYNWALPSPFHGPGFGKRTAAIALNGWKISGYTTYQSGAPLQISTGEGFNTTYASGLTVPTIAHPNLPNNAITLPNGLVANSVSTSVWFGTNAYNVLIPALTCNPKSGLASGQYFNPKCFTTPAYGTQGPTNMPYMRNPAYFDTDLGIYKDFHFTSSRYIQFRASANNWINHPLPQFGLAGNSDISLNFQGTENATCAGCTDSTGNPLKVSFISPTNTNANTTGKPVFKTGSRLVTLAVKFYF